jgi:2-haloalkanoic acid dehalogenase type II
MTRLAEVQAFTFDVYGTLIDWETGIAQALAPWAERHGLAAGRDALLAAFARHETVRQQENPELRYPDVLELVFEDIARDFGVPASQGDAAAFGESVPDWPAFADAPDALARLARHARLAVISNVDRAGFVLSQARLGAEFDVVVTAEDAGAYKPDPAPFRLALDWLSEIGVGFDGILHVAQSPHHDLVPAGGLGLARCWIDRQGLAGGGSWGATPEVAGRPEPELRYDTLAALADAVAAARGT